MLSGWEEIDREKGEKRSENKNIQRFRVIVWMSERKKGLKIKTRERERERGRERERERERGR